MFLRLVKNRKTEPTNCTRAVHVLVTSTSCVDVLLVVDIRLLDGRFRPGQRRRFLFVANSQSAGAR